jgi:hypothetical protein
MKMFLSIIAVGFAMCGCAAPKMLHYDRPATTQVQFMQDRLDCIKQAQQPASSAYVGAYGGSASSEIVVSQGILVTCMAAKGYTVGKEGSLVAPPEAAILTVR